MNEFFLQAIWDQNSSNNETKISRGMLGIMYDQA